jgi:hypothetical protein
MEKILSKWVFCFLSIAVETESSYNMKAGSTASFQASLASPTILEGLSKPVKPPASPQPGKGLGLRAFSAAGNHCSAFPNRLALLALSIRS